MGRVRDMQEKILYFLSKRMDYPLMPPRNVTLTLNYICNQACIMCDIKNQRFDREYEITCKEVKKIIDEMADLEIPDLVLTGGEPFLYKDIFEVIDYAKERDRKVIMITNGFFPEAVVEKIIAKKPDHLQVSLDGSSPQIYDSIRGTAGSFDIVTANIKKFTDAGLSTSATATITRQNYRDLMNIARLAKRLGCIRLALRPAHVSNADPLSMDFSDVLFWIPPSEIKILEGVCNELKSFNEEENFLDFLPGVELLPQYFKDGFLSSAESCFIGFTRLIISYNERKSYGVWMCRDMIGDIREKSLKEIWYGHEAKKMRKLIKACDKACLFPEIHEPCLADIDRLTKHIRKYIGDVIQRSSEPPEWV